MNIGKVLWFESRRGIGFLEDERTGTEVFFNSLGLAEGEGNSFETGAHVSFEYGEDPDLGKPLAIMVRAAAK